VDGRVGGGSIESAAQWQWGDVENAMNEWATMAANKLYSWTSGATKPGARGRKGLRACREGPI